MKKRSIVIIGIIGFLATLVIGATILHLYSKNHAEQKNDAYVLEQGIPFDQIRDISYVWDWEFSGDYIKRIKVDGEKEGVVYQYFYTGKGQPILFRPYSKEEGTEVEVKYPSKDNN
ncbi:hypothetical protein PWEIH_15348 [Listeria weihenstephanensis FSL R9-0317]|uniref:DUF3139 domain-containing protein n=1 Tax=Listeria weihenstephanensis TaxID=1006155 RepID=A0A1S7FTB4_9LIST|nr:hypothetical protein [Listeria weihenstephanensis]AQY50640.1 hypothetical protein UE46_06065 [Listeria weihenstephanensis]EUJ35595.1 hypothetical protein PWEIH_15348 [Listeria weihenstephanensis FSL R9-0317]